MLGRELGLTNLLVAPEKFSEDVPFRMMPFHHHRCLVGFLQNPLEQLCILASLGMKEVPGCVSWSICSAKNSYEMFLATPIKTN